MMKPIRGGPMFRLLRVLCYCYAATVLIDVPVFGDVTTGQITAVAVPALLLLNVLGSRSSLPVGREVAGIHTGFAWSVYLIVLGGLLSVFVAIDVEVAIHYVLRYVLGYLTVMAFAAAFQDRKSTSRVLNVLMMVAVGVSLVVVVGLSIPAVRSELFMNADYMSRRAKGFNQHPNQFAMLLASVAPLFISGSLQGRLIRRLLSLAIVFAGIFLSGSRFNIAIAVVSVSVMGLAYVGTRRTLWRRAYALHIFVLVVFGAVTAGISLLPNLSPRAADAFAAVLVASSGGSDVGILGVREEYYRTAISTFYAHPLTGIGARNGGFYLPVGHAHNIFLEAAMTTGIVGLLGMSLFAATLARLVFRLGAAARAEDRPNIDRLVYFAVAIGTTSYFLSNLLSDSMGGVTVRILWVFMGCGFCLVRSSGDRESGVANVAVNQYSTPAIE